MTRERRLPQPAALAFLAAIGLVAAGCAGVSAGVRTATSADQSGAQTARTLRDTRTAVPAGFQWHSLLVGDTRRTFLLHVPTGLHKPAPLVIALHGLHLSAPWMATRTNLAAAADDAGVVLAIPASLYGAWNDGRLGAGGPNDEQFIRDLATSLSGQGLADPHRVVISGFSNGAEMALVMASRYPQEFAAVVSISGELLSERHAVRPHAPIPAIFTHGTTDPVQPYDGRPSHGPLWPSLESEQATVAAFVAANHLSGAPTTRVIATSSGSHRVIELMWKAAPGGAPVTLYQIVGGGHVWPRRDRPSHTDPRPAGIDASALIMRAAVTYHRSADSTDSAEPAGPSQEKS
jgi:polyhydroxybutyrate depolymerase